MFQRTLSGLTIGQYWITPPDLYQKLDAEFRFDFDPCPYPYKQDGIGIEWGQSNYVNPPFRVKDAHNGHGPTAFVRKAIEENKKGKTIVMLLNIDTSTKWFAKLVEANAEILWFSRRIKFIDGKAANFPSMLVILK